MPRRLLLIATLVLTLAANAAPASEALFCRRPAIDADGSTIVFSHQGDLWSVAAAGGRAVRLTAHEAYDGWPVFAPDGVTLAFASDRYGDFDVFVMPADGGPPARLTHAETTDRPCAFSPDGEELYFASRRLFDFPMSQQIQSVPVAGGTPLRLADFFGDEAATADGNTFVIAQGRVAAGRVRYRGSYQRELWRWTRGGDPVRLTENRGYDTHPMVAPDGRVYWVGDMGEAKTANVWTMDPDGGGKRPLTDFAGDGVRAAALSADGARIVFERGLHLWTLDTAGGDPVRLRIDVAADQVENPVVVETKSGDAGELAVSADGEEYALVIEGEIVLVSKELGGRATVAEPGAWRERDISFRPGGADTLLLVTDRGGEDAVCLLVAGDGEASPLRAAREHRLVELTDGKRPCTRPLWSPDGERIAYVRGNGDLRVMDADGGHDRSVSASWNLGDVAWSPDGRWLAFARLDPDYNSEIWIVPAEGGEPVNVTRHPEYDETPVWSVDGTMLAWHTTRHNHAPNRRDYDVYMMYLREADHDRSREDWKILEKTRDDAPDKNGDDEEGDDEEEAAEEELVVEIDFDEIHLRAVRVTSLPGSEFIYALDPEGDRIYFTASLDGDRDLYAVDRFGEEREAVTEGDTDPRNITLDETGKTFTFLKNGAPATVGADGGKVETTEFTARLVVDRPAIRKRTLDEAWRTLRDRFYDPDMHGVDWPAAREKYGAWVAHAACDRDFGDLMNLMLGELNASHMGYRPGWDSPGDYGDDGWLGLEFDTAHRGEGLKVSRVLTDGPCDMAPDRLRAGDVLLSVDGRPVGRGASLEAALETRADLPTWLVLERDGDELEIRVTPAGWRAVWTLNHRDAERAKRAHTEARSDGRVGYVHIQGMGFAEVERFQQNLFAAADGKEALIIDVRNNGGGWTTDLLLTILTQPVHAFTIGRDGETGYPQVERQPFFRWSKPVAVICNEGSYSNAEIFSHAVKTLGRGPVIGTETGGNVISTGAFRNRYRGYVRLPGRGWYVWGDDAHPERNGKPQEARHDLTGCLPDHVVPLTPADRMHDRDPQLDRAVELMLEAADAERRAPRREPK